MIDGDNDNDGADEVDDSPVGVVVVVVVVVVAVSAAVAATVAAADGDAVVADAVNTLSFISLIFPSQIIHLYSLFHSRSLHFFYMTMMIRVPRLKSIRWTACVEMCGNQRLTADTVKSSYKTHQIPKVKCFSSRLAVVFVQSIETRCWVENEGVVGAVPTGDAPTTGEWSTILSPVKVRLILES